MARVLPRRVEELAVCLVVLLAELGLYFFLGLGPIFHPQPDTDAALFLVACSGAYLILRIIWRVVLAPLSLLKGHVIHGPFLVAALGVGLAGAASYVYTSTGGLSSKGVKAFVGHYLPEPWGSFAGSKASALQTELDFLFRLAVLILALHVVLGLLVAPLYAAYYLLRTLSTPKTQAGLAGEGSVTDQEEDIRKEVTETDQQASSSHKKSD